MIRTGLVSISFRRLTSAQIINCMTTCALKDIEWGGDVHVPAGDTDKAHEVRRLTEAAGLSVCAYGSYFRAGCSNSPETEFGAVLDCARELHSPSIRIWAGSKDSAELSTLEYDLLVNQSRIAADLAAVHGIRVFFECHGNTCTDDYTAALRLVDRIGRDNMLMHFQPNQKKSEAYNLTAAKALAPLCRTVHVFCWDAENRYPLSSGADSWRRYIDIFCTEGNDCSFLLEFMPDDRPETLPAEAETLHRFLSELK